MATCSTTSGLATPEELTLRAALEELAELKPQSARTIHLRFFEGLSLEEVARVLGVSRSSVKNYQRFAFAFLRSRLVHE